MARKFLEPTFFSSPGQHPPNANCVQAQLKQHCYRPAMNCTPLPFSSHPALVRGWVQELDADHVSGAVQILQAAARRAALLGTISWTDEEVNRQKILPLAERRELFGWISDGELLGCLVIQSHDEVHWPEDKSGEALYLHKLAVRPVACGSGIAPALIEFACARARISQREAVRLDTVPKSPLVAYYAAQGFCPDPNGPADYAGRWLIRMERRLGRQLMANQKGADGK
jgi:predicted N-acetyltransferase YhbS